MGVWLINYMCFMFFIAEAREAITLDSKVLRGTSKPALLTVSVHNAITLMAYIIFRVV